MGELIVIGFFTLGAIGLTVMGYVVGRIDEIEMEEEKRSEEKRQENREKAFIDRIRSRSRKYKRIDFDLRECS